MSEKQKKQFSLSLLVRIFLAVIVVVSIAVFVNSVMRYNELRMEQEELEQTKIELQEESVSELIEAVKVSTEAALKEKNMALITECDMDTLPMDLDLMRSALVNLVENAKRASEDGQTITLTAHDSIIEVTDHGKGIPKEEIARITEPFYMVDRSRSKLYGGSGLGMALVQRIIEAHDAKLVIESEENMGTTMRIVFQKR